MKNDQKKMSEEKPKQSNRDLMERYLLEEQENHLLRCQSRHVLKMGSIKLEIIPTDKTQSLKETMQEFTKFAKILQKLHGNAHLVCCDVNEGKNPMAALMQNEMYE